MGLILSNLVRSPCGCVTLAGEVSKAHYHIVCKLPTIVRNTSVSGLLWFKCLAWHLLCFHPRKPSIPSYSDVEWTLLWVVWYSHTSACFRPLPLSGWLPFHFTQHGDSDDVWPWHFRWGQQLCGWLSVFRAIRINYTFWISIKHYHCLIYWNLSVLYPMVPLRQISTPICWTSPSCKTFSGKF